MDVVGFWQQMVTPWVQARFGKSERGVAALVEYALVLALIAVVCIVALQLRGGESAGTFS